jgi:protein-L-isoaspartate(D-aspartate) O-methyltransferase
MSDRQQPSLPMAARSALPMAARSAVWIVAIGLWIGLVALAVVFWGPTDPAPPATGPSDLGPPAPVANAAAESGDWAAARRTMVDEQLRGRDIVDPRVLAAMQAVPRHRFVPETLQHAAYFDRALPIGQGQTISQPYIVALMTQLAGVGPASRVLEIGTGSGYQAAVLAEICQEVHSIEIVAPLAESAGALLADLGYANVTVRHGDGYEGSPAHAPFDAILVTAAPHHVPQPLVDQLAVGGRMVLPLGTDSQELVVLEKQPDGELARSVVAPVMFVPMTGERHARGEKSQR